jgi:hypothetical protein
MSTQLGSTITPFAATVLIIGFGWSGWLVFGAVMCAAGLLAPVVVRAARKDPTRSGFSAPDEPAKVPETRPATDEPTTVSGDEAAGDPLSTDRS